MLDCSPKAIDPLSTRRPHGDLFGCNFFPFLFWFTIEDEKNFGSINSSFRKTLKSVEKKKKSLLDLTKVMTNSKIFVEKLGNMQLICIFFLIQLERKMEVKFLFVMKADLKTILSVYRKQTVSKIIYDFICRDIKYLLNNLGKFYIIYWFTCKDTKHHWKKHNCEYKPVKVPS